MAFVSLTLPLVPALAAIAVRLYLSLVQSTPSDSIDLNGMRQTKA